MNATAHDHIRPTDQPVGDNVVRAVLVPLADRPQELAVIALLAGFVVFVYPSASVFTWTPSIALTWFAAPVTLTALVWRAWRGDVAARLAVVLAGWCVFTSLISAAPVNSLIGSVSRFNSTLVFVTGLGCWALAASLSPAGRRALCWAVVAASGLSASVGVLQMVLKPTGGFLAYGFDRPSGFAINPVYLAAHVGAATAFFVYRFSRDCKWLDLAGVGVFSFFTALTGSRVATVAVIVVGVAAIVAARTLMSAAVVPAVVVGAFAAQLVHGVTGSQQSAADRVNLGELDMRFRIWRFGLRAWLDRPFTGFGLGRFRGASQRYYSDDWVRFTEGDDAAFAFMDAHNLIVQVLVTLGVVGLVLFVAFIARASWRSRGPGVWMAAVMFATWMMQPPVAQTWPVGLALLGSASVHSVVALRERRWGSRVVVSAAVGLGLFLGGSMIVADHVSTSVADRRNWELPTSMWILSRDPVVASSMADAVFDPTKEDPGPETYVLRWSERAAEYDPDFPFWWAKLGLRRLRYEDVAGARAAAERGVELQPNHIASWQVLRIVAQRTDDDELLRRADAMLCRFDLGPCAGQGSST